MTTEKIKNKVSPDEIVAWVGLDWADSEHRISMYDVATGQIEDSVLKQSGEALQQWLAELGKRYGGGRGGVEFGEWGGGGGCGVLGGGLICACAVQTPA